MRLENVLDAPTGPGEPARVIRRKASAILRACGLSRSSAVFWTDLSSALDAARICHDLDRRRVAPNTWIKFGRVPIEEDRHRFPEEAAIRTFVKKALGQGIFRNLRPLRSRIRQSGKEFRLLDNTRVDLLCEEKLGRRWTGLVAIEFKHQRVREAPAQMIAYLTQLRREFPGRQVRGLIITSEEDAQVATLLLNIRGFDIEWITYRVDFHRAERVIRDRASGNY
ncbi:MAG: hypothetical protein ABR602_10755 [Gemmatimonadales bacterium]